MSYMLDGPGVNLGCWAQEPKVLPKKYFRRYHWPPVQSTCALDVTGLSGMTQAPDLHNALNSVSALR